MAERWLERVGQWWLRSSTEISEAKTFGLLWWHGRIHFDVIEFWLAWDRRIWMINFNYYTFIWLFRHLILIELRRKSLTDQCLIGWAEFDLVRDFSASDFMQLTAYVGPSVEGWIVRLENSLRHVDRHYGDGGQWFQWFWDNAGSL